MPRWRGRVGNGRGTHMADGWTGREDEFLLSAVRSSRISLVAADMRAGDQPLVYVNKAFETLTGYSTEEIVGRNCRFLQGPDTDPQTVAQIRAAIAERRDAYFEILNYRKDGTPFWNGLHIGPASGFDDGSDLFFAYQRDVTAEVEARQSHDLIARELRHRLGNLLAIVGIIVRSTEGGQGEDALRQNLERRIRALNAANSLIFPAVDPAGLTDSFGPQARIPLQTIVSTILEAVDHEGRILLDGPDIAIGESGVTNVALALHELTTNAAKYGALSDAGGTIEISWRDGDGRVLIDWVESGLAPVPAEEGRKGMGTRLLRTIVGSSARPDAVLAREDDRLIFRFDAPAAD